MIRNYISTDVICPWKWRWGLIWFKAGCELNFRFESKMISEQNYVHLGEYVLIFSLLVSYMAGPLELSILMSSAVN